MSLLAVPSPHCLTTGRIIFKDLAPIDCNEVQIHNQTYELFGKPPTNQTQARPSYPHMQAKYACQIPGLTFDHLHVRSSVWLLLRSSA